MGSSSPPMKCSMRFPANTPRCPRPSLPPPCPANHPRFQNFPVQLSGEFETEDDLLGTVVGVTAAGSAVYLRDMFEVRRGYENPISYSVDVLHRNRRQGGVSLVQARSV